MQPLRTVAEWEMDRQRAETNIERRRRQAFIPVRYWDATWEAYEPDVGTRAVDDLPEESLKHILLGYAEETKRLQAAGTPQGEGLVLLGPPGYGKTLGMALLAMELSDAMVWVRWATNVDIGNRRKALMTLQQEAQSSGDWGDANAAEYRLKFFTEECDVLFLDDVGKEYRSAGKWSDSALDELLRGRRQAGKATVLSSNLSGADWAAYNSSMGSFLHELGEVVTLDWGHDHRRAPSAARRRRAGML